MNITTVKAQNRLLIGLSQFKVRFIHVDAKNVQKGLNEASKVRSVVSQPSNSVIKNSETSANKLPQTGESDGFNYSALGVLLGLNVAIAAVGAEKKRKKY